MRRLLVLLLMPAAILARSGVVESAPREIPRIIIPGAGFGPAAGPGVVLLPFAPTISISAPPSIIVPAAPAILKPAAAAIIVAARPFTPDENAPAKALSGDELKRLADSLAPARDGAETDAGRPAALDAAFDGKLAPEAEAWSGVSEQFSAGPLAPGLPVVKTAAVSLIARLLPAFYRRVPTRSCSRW